MPVPLRATHHRAEAKYNVTTDFPNFGLHSAASTGDVGLVEYALSRGQPVNSVVDGVLPLHAACAGGSVHVVKLLIDYCADVNAPRLPKRYSSRDSSAPIIGTTGSTPLHFAAANGNRDAIKLLLRHGAHANRADKHGVTPEMLARENGWIECADLLKEWIINKDKDLREREEFVATNDRDDGRRRNRMGSVGDAESSQTHRHRLHVKQSIDTALNMLRSSSSNLGEAYRRNGLTPTPPTSPTRPFGDFTSELGNNNQFPDVSTRRPSLTPADSFPRVRRPSARSEQPHRPRSAGEGADQGTASPVPSYGRPPTTRKVGSKVSLLNLFRKGQNQESPSPPETITNPPASDRPILSTSPSKGAAINSGSFLTHHRSRLHQDSDASIRSRTTTETSLERKSSLNSPSRSPVPLAVDSHNALVQGQQQINNRDRSRSNASSRYEYLNEDPVTSGQGSYQSAGSSPLARLGLLRNQHHRARSGSGSSLTHEANVPSRLALSSTTPTVEDTTTTTTTNYDDDKTGVAGADTDNLSRSLPRSGILRPHNRNGSGGQNHMTPSALRALRFDTPSANGNGADGDLTASFSGGPVSHSPSPRSTPVRLKSSNSVGSLGKSESHTKQRARRRPGSAGSMSGPKQSDGNDEEREVIEERAEEGEGDEGEEEEYGKPIEARVTPSLLIGVGGKTSSRTSLSPIISNDHTSGGGNDDTLMADFPFSINRPPPIPVDGEVEEKDMLPPRLTARVTDTRNRGDSLSSGGTVDSQQTSSAASTRMVVTPLISSEVVPPSDKKEESLVSGAEVGDAGDEDGGPQFIIVSPAIDLSPSARPGGGRPGPLPLQKASPPTHSHEVSTSSPAPTSTSYSGGNSSTRSMSGRRTHTPFDIDISSISSHAQAEALVEKARREVMELANMDEQDLSSEAGGEGRTPLSARLAAYGESLALEKKFRELEKGITSTASTATTSTMPMSGKESIIGTDASSTNLTLPVANQRSVDGYPASLYSGKSIGGTRDTSPRSVNVSATPSTHVKRPSTAEGLAPRDANLSLSSEQSDQSYQSSRSVSAMGHRRGAESNPYHQFAIPTLNVPSSSDEDSGTYHRPSPSLNYITRSRTPTADYGDSLKPGRMASLDGVEYSEDRLELSRVSTAPSPVRPPPPGRSARKLAKMGISVVDQTNKGAPVQSLGHTGGRFGVIKSLFKGKS